MNHLFTTIHDIIKNRPSYKLLDIHQDEYLILTPNYSTEMMGELTSLLDKKYQTSLRAKIEGTSNFLKNHLKQTICLCSNNQNKLIISLMACLKKQRDCAILSPNLSPDAWEKITSALSEKVIFLDEQMLEKLGISTIKKINYVNHNIKTTATRPTLKDLDNNLPLINRSHINNERYFQEPCTARVKNTISLQSSRGCPYKCSYCHNIWPKKINLRSAENLFEELMLYYNLGVKRFEILDDVFNLNVKNSSDFFKKIIKHDLDVNLFFPNGVRGDILTKNYIDLMVEAGTVNIAFALETASPRLQKLINKNLDIEILRENTEYLAKKYPSVYLELFTMHGLPTETEDEAMLTLNFIKEIKWIHLPQINILKIFQNTKMADLAIQNGVKLEDIIASENLAYHELPSTLPFRKSFTTQYQADFWLTYLMSPERLLHLIPHQAKIFTEEEFIKQYDNLFPVSIKSMSDLAQFAQLDLSKIKDMKFVDDNKFEVPNINEKINAIFSTKKKGAPNHQKTNKVKTLIIDTSVFFSYQHPEMMYNLVEAPIGPLSIISYLEKTIPDLTKGKLIKSRIDFDNYNELKTIINDFNPDVIGIRTLNFFKDFTHLIIEKIRQWGFLKTLMIGGPYATSSYDLALNDLNIDLAVIGEGEETMRELLIEVKNHDSHLPTEDTLKSIAGIAFNPERFSENINKPKKLILLDDTEMLH